MPLDERRNEMEARYAHDQDLRFRAESRRNRLFAHWVADRLGKTGDDRETYAQEMMKASFAKPGDEDLSEKALADLAAGGVPHSDDDIKRQLHRLLLEAREQLSDAR